MKHLKEKINYDIKYILFLFIVTRVALTFLGTSARSIAAKVDDNFYDWYTWRYSEPLWTDIWSIWDSPWYLDIAKNGYSIKRDISLPRLFAPGQTNYGFFPFYPLLIGVLGNISGSHYASALVISNLSLLVASIFLYKLVLHDSGKSTAKKSVKYLFLFPTAFVFSGVFSESLFLALLLICFYYAKKDNWPAVAAAGFFMALTKPVGVFMFIPLLYQYLKKRSFNFKKIKPNILFLSFIPIGLFAFMLFCYLSSGDLLAYFHSKQSGWGVHLSHPFELLLIAPATGDPTYMFVGFFTLSLILFFLLNYGKVDRLYRIIAVLLIAFPLFSGKLAMLSMPRHSLLAFPFFLVLAKLGKSRAYDKTATWSLVFLQGLLMISWSIGILIV